MKDKENTLIVIVKEDARPIVDRFFGSIVELDGLTNGEVLHKIFPKWEMVGWNDKSIDINVDGKKVISIRRDWWNSKWGE